eukprot:1080402-Prymnesium_polylepis.1
MSNRDEKSRAIEKLHIRTSIAVLHAARAKAKAGLFILMSKARSEHAYSRVQLALSIQLNSRLFKLSCELQFCIFMRACDNQTSDVLWRQRARGVRHRVRHHGCALRMRTAERGNNGMVLWRGA